MKRILISFLVLALAFMIAAPATAMGRVPGKNIAAAETLPTEIFGKTLDIPEGTAGTPPVAKGKMIGQINPDPGHVKRPDGTPALAKTETFAEPVIWVYPRCQHKPAPQTGEYRDITNVQWAVDNVASGGTVVLKTTDPDDGVLKAFYFGETDSDYIAIGEDLTIMGDKLSSVMGNDWDSAGTYNADFAIPKGGTLKSDRAVIYGGGKTEIIWGWLPYFRGTLHMEQQNKLAVEGLRFEQSRFSCVSVYSSADVDINDNVITNVKVEDSWLFGPKHWSLCFSEFYKELFGYQLPGIAGPINVAHNFIDQIGPDVSVPDQWGDAIIFFFASSPSIGTVDYNTIQNCPDVGIFVYYYGSEILITNNEITQRDYGITPGPLRWCVLVAGSNNADIIENTMSVSEGPEAKFYSNAVNVTGVDDSEIRGNTIHIEKRAGVAVQAIALDGPHGSVEHCTVKDNIISGNPDYAIAVGHVYTEYIYNCNQIEGNDYTGVTGAGYRVYLGGPAINNTVIETGLSCIQIANPPEDDAICGDAGYDGGKPRYYWVDDDENCILELKNNYIEAGEGECETSGTPSCP